MTPFRVATVLLALLVVTSCATATRSRSTRVTAESLEAAATQFVEVAKLYNQALDAETITKEQYRAWAAFAKPFQRSYPAAVAAWNAAAIAHDAAGMDKLQAEIAPLLTQLSKFAFDVYAATSK